jgi:L-2,4-diaminobutyrate decarboxylase
MMPDSAAFERIQAIYDPELFRAAGRRWADLLANHFAEVEASAKSVLNWNDPLPNCERAARELNAPLSAHSGTPSLVERFSELMQLILARGQNLHDPRYMGHQVPASIPFAGLFDAVGSAANQVMAIYEMGPWATAVEHSLVDRLAGYLGWQGTDYAGIVTHGGSIANTTGLLAARNVALGESWEAGNPRNGPAPVIVSQADAHYCVARAGGILGIGTKQVIKAPLDSRRRMDPERLHGLLTELRAAGHPIIAVAACACATPIGAFDPLDDIADVCARHGVWMHVDAAHGGAALMSPRYRHLVAGLERADSLVWDAHKMLFVPALCAFLFYKEKRHSFAAFQQDAPYLFDPSAPDLADFDGGLRTLECTKRAATLGLWGAWSMFGPQLFADLVEVTFDLGRVFYEKLREAPDFVPLHEPQCNIVVFRYTPAELRAAPLEKLGDFQLQLRRKVINSGEFYLVPTQFQGTPALRVTLINPLTTPEHLDQLLATLRRQGAELLTSSITG